MRELWGGQIEREEINAHCRHSREAEIRILNRRKNCVSSYVPTKMPAVGNEKKTHNFSLQEFVQNNLEQTVVSCICKQKI